MPEATEEPTRPDTTAPIPPRSEPIRESRLRTLDSSNNHSEEERPEISTPHSRKPITVSVTSEGIREISTGGDRVVLPISTMPSSATPDIPHTTCASLSDHERILTRAREQLRDNMQMISSEYRRLSREIRQRTMEAMESTSSVTLTEEEDFLEERRRQNRPSSPRVPP